MDVSPKTLREVEFREKLRGYHPEDVDQFLEQVATGLEGMQDRLRQAVERAQRAESAAEAAAAAPIDTASNDETLRKTLVLAQRTADLAVQEAREQAARILSSAEQQAQARVSEAEERARRTHEDALSDIRSELSSLEVTRQRAQQEVDSLNRWVEEHRAQISSSLSEALSLVERVGVRSPAPVSRPIDVPPGPRGERPGLSGGPGPSGPLSGEPPPGRAATPSGPALPPASASSASPPSLASPPRPSPPVGGPGPAPGAEPSGSGAPPPSFAMPSRPDDREEAGPPTVAWSPSPAERRALDDEEGDPTPGHGTPPVTDHVELDPEEQALDDFFEDDDYAGERRFGGRLRRRR